jgi:hypothetical protein
MPATKIILIRHAEKPDDTDGGVDPKGKPDKHDLIVRGWQRAGALVQFFANPRDPNGPIGRPATLFATEPTSGSESKRPLHTVTPLEQWLNIPIDSTIAEGSEQDLVDKAIASNSVVLIAWHHEKIPGDRQSDPAKSEHAAEVAGRPLRRGVDFQPRRRQRAVDIFASAAAPAVRRFPERDQVELIHITTTLVPTWTRP